MDKREADWLTKSLNHTHKAHPQLLDALEIVDKELDRQRERPTSWRSRSRSWRNE